MNRHANAQVEPEEGRLIDTRRARSYLENFFTKTNIAIYWGRSEDFMRDLTLQLQQNRARIRTGGISWNLTSNKGIHAPTHTLDRARLNSRAAIRARQ